MHICIYFYRMQTQPKILRLRWNGCLFLSEDFQSQNTPNLIILSQQPYRVGNWNSFLAWAKVCSQTDWTRPQWPPSFIVSDCSCKNFSWYCKTTKTKPKVCCLACCKSKDCSLLTNQKNCKSPSDINYYRR